MKAFLKDELERFLLAIDQALGQPVEVIVIGGTERLATGLDIPVTQSGVADAPDDFESRLERVLPHLDRLRVWVPEKHDLTLMKAMRAYEHDLQAIVEIHANSPLDLDTLVRRFQDEMTPIGDPARIRDNVLAVVERLFPDHVDDVARRLQKPPS